MLRISLIVLVSIIAVLGVIAVVLIPGGPKPYTDIVQTTSGPIRGEELEYEGLNYKAFKGIPYAAPPVGDLKFKAPAPPEKWTEVRDTRDFGYICHQQHQTKSSSEDCLTLNVYTQSLGTNTSRPVLVWIHGGGFFGGDGTDRIYGPQYLLQGEIVVVTINYRLGPLGFLATTTSDASGNWGLKDQVAALKWVQNNIANFGGNPNSVTIYGESAGAASAHLHLFSPLSKGLFHKVIASSGTVANHWILNTESEKERYSRNMAKILGASEIEIENPAKRIDFLRKADSKEMTERFLQVLTDEDRKHPLFNPIPFTPVIEPAGTEGAFITEDPKKLLLEGKFARVPMMMGVNDLEGGLVFMGYGKEYSPTDVEKNVCNLLPDQLKEAVIAKNECLLVAQAIRDAYFEGKPFDSSELNFIYLYGDLFMSKDAHLAQRVHAKLATEETPVYNYFFTFDGNWNLMKRLFGITLPGATHGDDVAYVFRPRQIHLPNSPSLPDVKTKDRMTSFIINFVKYSNPTPAISELVPVKWESAKGTGDPTMVIGKNLNLENDFLKTRLGMWDELYKKYTGKPLYP